MTINASLPSSTLPFGLDCFFIPSSSVIFITYTITNLLLLAPLCVFVLSVRLQRRRQHRSSPTAATTSHSDVFTYHMVTMETINVFGTILGCVSVYINYTPMLMVWYCLFAMSWYGETFFHILTCMEHYLAVVHPVTYLSLRKHRGIRIRNATIVCIWLFCCLGTSLGATRIQTSVLDAVLMISSVIIISICSLSVLCVLIRPGPGDQGRDPGVVGQSKQRAFYTIVAILGVLMLRCTTNLGWSFSSLLNGMMHECPWIFVEVWSNLPSSLTLPLLFLHRAGSLACGKKKNVP